MSADATSVERQTQESKFSRDIRENRAYLRNVIQYYLGSLDNRLPRDGDGVLQVLSVGCGFGYEAGPVVDVFRNCHYKGIDDGKAIRMAVNFLNRDLSAEKVNFSIEDAREMNEDDTDKYGLVVIRHPQVMGSVLKGESTVGDWRRIIEASVKKTVQNGYLFITVESDTEREIVVSYLLKNKVDVLIVQNNEFLQHAPKSLVFKDGIVIIGTK